MYMLTGLVSPYILVFPCVSCISMSEIYELSDIFYLLIMFNIVLYLLSNYFLFISLSFFLLLVQKASCS